MILAGLYLELTKGVHTPMFFMLWQMHQFQLQTNTAWCLKKGGRRNQSRPLVRSFFNAVKEAFLRPRTLSLCLDPVLA